MNGVKWIAAATLVAALGLPVHANQEHHQAMPTADESASIPTTATRDKDGAMPHDDGPMQQMHDRHHAPGGHMNAGDGMGMPAAQAGGYQLPEPAPEDLAAAFPDLGGMDLREHMRSPFLAYLLIDQLEWLDTDEGSSAWELSGWAGYDFNRLWLRSEGERSAGEFEAAEAHLLYGRAIARWWDLVAGIRQDFEPGPSRTYAALGVQGLAPYWFETELTLYAGESGQTGARLEVEYEWLLSQRLVLQPLLELNAWGRNQPESGIGAGLANAEAGVRLRYEIRREFAPYIGLSWERAFGNTAELLEAGGGDVEETALLAGLRLWF